MEETSVLETGMPDLHSVSWKMRRIQQRSIKLSADLLAEHQLHFGQPRLMNLIKNHPEASQKELAEKMLVTDAAMSHSVKRLTQLEYVEAKMDPSDQRRKILTLTARGQETLAACDKGLDEIYERMFIGFEQEDLLRLSRMLDAISSNLGNAKPQKGNDQ